MNLGKKPRIRKLSASLWICWLEFRVGGVFGNPKICRGCAETPEGAYWDFVRNAAELEIKLLPIKTGH